MHQDLSEYDTDLILGGQYFDLLVPINGVTNYLQKLINPHLLKIRYDLEGHVYYWPIR
jgi:hypothetical protein